MGIPIFRENTDHTVYRNSEGVVVPSITTLIKIINKPELINWANYLGFKRKSVTKELESAAFIGETVHRIIDIYTTKGLYSLSDMNVRGPAERICIKNAFLSFMKFYSEEKNSLNILRTEDKISGEKFGGTLDLLCNYNDILTLGDYKTSKTFYPTMFLQLAGYDLLLQETEGIEVDQYMVILLDKKMGKRAKVKICNNREEMEIYRRCFRYLVDFYYDWYYINQTYWNTELIK